MTIAWKPSSQHQPFARAALDYAHNMARVMIDWDAKPTEAAPGAAWLVGQLVGIADEAADASIQHLLDYGRQTLGQTRPVSFPESPVRDGLQIVKETFALTEPEFTVLVFALTVANSTPLRSFTELFGRVSQEQARRLVAAATGLDRSAVTTALSRRSTLRSTDLVTDDAYDTRFLASFITPKDGLFDLITEPNLSRNALLKRYLPETPPTSLTFADYAHLGPAIGDIKALLQNAIARTTSGINILFHGVPGTGKTELSRVLADDLSVPLYVAHDRGGADDVPASRDRLTDLCLGHRLILPGSAILLFDEMEDLLNEPANDSRCSNVSKLWMNELLELNAVPTVWIANSLDGADPAFLRRFSYALEFRPLGPAQREKVLRRHLSIPHALTVDDIRKVATDFEVSPAQYSSAVAVSRLIEPQVDRSTLERVLDPIARLVDGAPQRKTAFDPTTYSTAALNASEDLTTLADDLATWKPTSNVGLSLCLYGPPGTGKSLYVRFLAYRMEKSVIYRHASQLISPLSGLTERNIASAFRLAEEQDAVLVFDEVDSFLRDRRTLSHSWEATAVNELLQQLEAFRGVVACTTNLVEHMDPASLRRFVFKIELRPLRPEQSAAHFEATLGCFLHEPIGASERATLPRLLGSVTPGVFAAVSRRMRALDKRADVATLVEAVAAEAKQERLNTTPAAGFKLVDPVAGGRRRHWNERG